MIVERIWTGNSLRNYNYLIACPDTGEALAIDPLDHGKCLAAAKKNGWRITQILNTHEHHDHTGGNAAVVEATGAKVIAHHKAGGKIAGVDRGVKAGDIIKVGKRVELECLDTPGHTFCHICLRSHTDQPALFSGDTLFNAGAGNCHNGGDPGAMYETFAQQLESLPDNTQLYPGHDYIENNLKFTLSREPDNAAAKALLPQGGGPRPAELGRHHAAAGEDLQHLLPAHPPERDRQAARGLPRPAGETGPAHGVPQAARAAQQVVS